ncbi:MULTISPECIES: extracellular solute-binding protein [Phyllobacteriaceae]|nr:MULTISPECIES: extracellular solute-binding protein [Mesorhizobium]MBN9237785.1 extracellular solute-binding protein [Mesorhizobium sp.]MDQ0329450.1 multiple sugar transport system substrate-binding protein [Mesorhizobium sp. YL-MeA3-2017]
MADLRGMTWDHSRGFDPMVATSLDYARRHPGVSITWEKRSLQAFADRPIAEMAETYDLMVIDHPHVGEVAQQGNLLPLDGLRDDEMARLAACSVGLSHPSYQFAGRQWALAIDTATPVACLRPDRLRQAPALWREVLDLARKDEVAFALVPINALMTFFGIARNLDYPVAETDDDLLDREHAGHVLELLAEIAGLMDKRCLSLDPIGIYEWMGRDADGPSYSPFGYGYTNYSRDGFCPHLLVFHDAPGISQATPKGTVLGGTGIAVSAFSKHKDIAVDYAFWIAGGDCQRGLFTSSGGQPAHAAAWDDDVCNNTTSDFFRNTRRTLETAWVRPRYHGYMKLQDRAGDIVHAFLRREADSAATIASLNTAYRECRS